jgi:glycosyltransferase involved in cell wall biosynthesis
MKIAVVGTVVSSVLNFRSELIQSLSSQGHTVYVFASDYTPAAKDRIVQLGAIPMDYGIKRASFNPFSDLKVLWQLIRIFNQIKPDSVFSFFAKPVIFATLAAQYAGVKRKVGMLEGLGYAFTESPGEKNFKKRLVATVQIFLYRLAFPFLDQLIFLNEDDQRKIASYISGLEEKSFILGPIGVPLDRFPASVPSTDFPLKFLFVGRLLKEKGIFELLQAAEAIKQKYPGKAEFWIVGPLDHENPGGITEDQINEFVKKGTVKFIGPVTNVPEWIKQSSVFILPSHREGFPRSTQEAMSVGRAVITTDAPGCRQSVIDGQTGFLFQVGDVSGLVDRITKFIQAPDLVQKMGQASRLDAEQNFDVVKVNHRLTAVILGSTGQS